MAADSGTRTLVRPRRRIASLDALRGLTLVSMIAYHACWDLVYLFHADWDWYRGTGAYIWQQSICWTFILLSGFCFSLGRRPLRGAGPAGGPSRQPPTRRGGGLSPPASPVSRCRV